MFGLLSRGSVRIRALRQKGQHDAFSHPTRALGTAARPPAVPRREHPRVARLPRITSLLTTATLSWSNGCDERLSGYQSRLTREAARSQSNAAGDFPCAAAYQPPRARAQRASVWT